MKLQLPFGATGVFVAPALVGEGAASLSSVWEPMYCVSWPVRATLAVSALARGFCPLTTVGSGIGLRFDMEFDAGAGVVDGKGHFIRAYLDTI